MAGRMQGKVAFVTGGSEGIGGATAERLAEEGANVVVCARRAEPLAKLAKKIRAAGGVVETLTLDVSDLEALSGAVQGIAKRYGRLDAVVNNAMVAEYGMITEMPIEDWRRTIHVNLDAVFVSTQMAMRIMKAQGGGSIFATLACAATAAYSTSKAALLQFTRVAAIEGGPFNVRVNAIAPGVLDTPAARRYGPAEQLERIGLATPIPRIGEARDGANAILYLLSDEAKYVTGVCIPVDGGKAQSIYVPS
jgi:meso-butanediol dehydrogenase / (S,S)-butanediol dehydrogenase / diacetyl reductase